MQTFFSAPLLIYKIVRNNCIHAGMKMTPEEKLAENLRRERRAGSMSEGFSITVNGKSVRVGEGVSVAAAVMMANEPSRTSVHGEPRAPLCGMGICIECRATVSGVLHSRSCKMTCKPGMTVVTE